jgi:hypothetical protein
LQHTAQKVLLRDDSHLRVTLFRCKIRHGEAHDEPRITPEEFEKVLRYGLMGKSTGVMMFTIGSVAADEGKMAVMKKVYTELAKGGG